MFDAIASPRLGEKPKPNSPSNYETNNLDYGCP